MEVKETPVVTVAQKSRIIDMTSGEAKELSSVSEQVLVVPQERFPELCHNIATITSLCKQGKFYNLKTLKELF
jgi:hypothetical protein